MKLTAILISVLFAIVASQYPGILYNPWFNSRFPPSNRSYGDYNPGYWRPPIYGPPRYNYTGLQFRAQVGGLPYLPYFPGSCIDITRHQCNGSHSLFAGCLLSNHKLLFQQAFIKPARWYSARKKIIDYPGNLGFVRNETITAISIQDRMCNGTGGYAQITKGGVGYPQVQIQLYSREAGTGFNFFVQLFGI